MTIFKIPDMSCGHCQSTVEKTIKDLDPEASFTFDMAARTVAVESRNDSHVVAAALAKAGYPATPA